jgi:hypothetical protein
VTNGENQTFTHSYNDSLNYSTGQDSVSHQHIHSHSVSVSVSIGSEASHTHPFTSVPSTTFATGATLLLDGTVISGFGPFNNGGSTDVDISNIDLTTAISTQFPTFGGGVHELDITSTQTGGIMAYLLIIGIVKSF